MAAQATTVRSEVLGSSDGSANQRLATTRAPLLPGQRLEVREPELLAAAERASLAAEEGPDILAAGDADGGRAVWVRWHEVPDFHASGPRSRHYVVDRLAGAILFGDGRNGLVPPVGTGNLRLAHYRTGGGSAGNRPAGTIAQLKTTVPYVDKVNNVAPAMGGSDAETLQQAAERVPRQVRHGDRAVTVEDYEDLAHEASPEVGRAWCIAPAGAGPDAGLVQVVVVPRSTDARPMPSAELVRRVQDHLATRCCATARVRVVAPDYLQLTVTAKVGVNSPGAAVAVVAAVQERIEAFLHPLTGGAGGTGWAIGARPRDLDFHLLLAHVPGLDHIDSLRIEQAAGEGVARSVRFLVCAGPPLVKAAL